MLLAKDGSVKLSDFGLGALPASLQSGDGLLRTVCGTPNYVAPEVLQRRGYEGAPADLWSLGEWCLPMPAAAQGRLPPCLAHHASLTWTTPQMHLVPDNICML